MASAFCRELNLPSSFQTCLHVLGVSLFEKTQFYGLSHKLVTSGVTQIRPCRVTSKPATLEVQDRSSDWGAGSLSWHGQCLGAPAKPARCSE